MAIGINAQLKAGDTVEVLRQPAHYLFTVGTVGTVLSVGGAMGGFTVSNGEDHWFYLDSDVKRIRMYGSDFHGGRAELMSNLRQADYKTGPYVILTTFHSSVRLGQIERREARHLGHGN